MSRLYSEQQTKLSRAIPEEGMTLARVYQVIELGEHTKPSLKNGVATQVAKYRYWIQLELPNLVYDFGKGEQPFSISREMPFTIQNPKDLGGEMVSPFSNLLFALGGRENYEKLWSQYTMSVTSESETTKLINDYFTNNQVCMIDVIHNVNESNPDIKYANIKDSKQLMKGMTCPKRVNKMFVFDFFSNFRNLELLPKFLQDKVKSSNTFMNGNYKVHSLPNQDPVITDELPVINTEDINVEMPF
jgi:hypothetical protein